MKFDSRNLNKWRVVELRIFTCNNKAAFKVRGDFIVDIKLDRTETYSSIFLLQNYLIYYLGLLVLNLAQNQSKEAKHPRKKENSAIL